MRSAGIVPFLHMLRHLSRTLFEPLTELSAKMRSAICVHFEGRIAGAYSPRIIAISSFSSSCDQVTRVPVASLLPLLRFFWSSCLFCVVGESSCLRGGGLLGVAAFGNFNPSSSLSLPVPPPSWSSSILPCIREEGQHPRSWASLSQRGGHGTGSHANEHARAHTP